jgi:NNP family nitrate/nitrite transporter-like MFS transporter
MASMNGHVTLVSDTLIRVDEKSYPLKRKDNTFDRVETKALILPTKDSWQQPMVETGDEVKKRQLLASGTTRIYFQANMWIYALLVMLIGIVWGIGKASVYKRITDYFPNEVGVVGGMVGVIGGLGGFFCPIIFGYLLDGTGLWTSSWMFILLISMVCFFWMRSVILKQERAKKVNV